MLPICSVWDLGLTPFPEAAGPVQYCYGDVLSSQHLCKSEQWGCSSL